MFLTDVLRDMLAQCIDFITVIIVQWLTLCFFKLTDVTFFLRWTEIDSSFLLWCRWTCNSYYCILFFFVHCAFYFRLSYKSLSLLEPTPMAGTYTLERPTYTIHEKIFTLTWGGPRFWETSACEYLGSLMGS